MFFIIYNFRAINKKLNFPEYRTFIYIEIKSTYFGLISIELKEYITHFDNIAIIITKF